VWHREAPHPGWKPGEDRGEVVSFSAIDDGDRLLSDRAAVERALA
jgi:hypothetical protein